jgi:hypothetical protein
MSGCNELPPLGINENRNSGGIIKYRGTGRPKLSCGGSRDHESEHHTEPMFVFRSKGEVRRNNRILRFALIGLMATGSTTSGT